MKIELKFKEEFDTSQEEERFLKTLANRHNYKNAVWDFSNLWTKFKYDEDELTLDKVKEAISFILEDNNINLNDLD